MKQVSIEYPETREIVGGEVHPRGTGARLEAALKLLRRLEWADRWTGDVACPICKVYRRDGGHAEYCELAALLRGDA